MLLYIGRGTHSPIRRKKGKKGKKPIHAGFEAFSAGKNDGKKWKEGFSLVAPLDGDQAHGAATRCLDGLFFDQAGLNQMIFQLGHVAPLD